MGFVFGDVAVGDGFCGADVVAGATTVAIFPPGRVAVFHLNVAGRTYLAAFAAMNAAF